MTTRSKSPVGTVSRKLAHWRETYFRHVKHALRYLKPGGTLTAILPATARYDHGFLSGSWQDLPVGSFSESGTNVNTCILTIRTESARAAA